MADKWKCLYVRPTTLLVVETLSAGILKAIWRGIFFDEGDTGKGSEIFEKN